MQRKLAEHGQFVALDPLFAERATMGGVLATNDSGALRHKYGSLRDLVIGMKIVLADGTVARAGGKVVKNVAGYDLPKLLTGSFGTLGVITEATFRLYALPEHLRSFTFSGVSAKDLTSFVLTVRSSHLLTQSIQLRTTESGRFELDIQLNSHPEARQVEMLRAMAESLGLVAAESSPDVWSAREQVFGHAADVVIKATMLPADAGSATEFVARAGGIAVTQALGIMTAALPSAQVLPELQRLITPSGGTITLLRSTVAKGGSVFQETSNALPLMRTLKQNFDPKRTLNPGRFLGGI